MISLQGVTKQFPGGKVAVDRLTLEVKGGEVFGFLGQNGAGKTTTLRMIVGLLQPDAGTITVDGIDVVAHPMEVKRRLGFVPDNPDLYERLSGLEYLTFIADVYGVAPEKRRSRILDLADRFELTAVLKERIGSYSHGMQQKLALLGALVHEPPVWILDEPMVGLDPRAAHLLKGLMAEHVKAGRTLFFSTHVLDVAEKLCDRLAIIRQGRLLAVGTMEELRQGRAAGESLESIFLELTGT